MNGKIRFWMLGVAGCFISAAAWSILFTPGAALAKGKPVNKGQFNTQGYWVWFSQDQPGAFEPEGPPPDGTALDAETGGAIDVVAGAIGDPNDPRMIVNFNQSCLPSFPGGSMTDPWVLSFLDDDFDSPDSDVFHDCFPEPSQGAMIISADGTTVQMNIHGLSKSGRDMGYQLTIDVLPTVQWDPLGMAPGISANLHLGAWTLTTSNPKQQSKGCSASGDFSNEFVAITVSRWTLDEQAAQDACE